MTLMWMMPRVNLVMHLCADFLTYQPEARVGADNFDQQAKESALSQGTAYLVLPCYNPHPTSQVNS